MDANQFLKVATDAAEWLKKSVALRRSADVLWEAFVGATLEWASQVRANPAMSATSWDEALEHLTSAKLLYGLALETALKGHILQVRPGDIEFKMTADGTGAVATAKVKHFGVALGQAHNLELLAERAGVFDRDSEPVFATDDDYRALREILKHLSEVIYWSGRYPVPLRSGETHKVPPDIPAKVFGHFIRDWLDQVLDRYQGEHWRAPTAGSAARLMDMMERYEHLRGKQQGQNEGGTAHVG